MKVLITCGPTWVAIDRVRVISNQSTGEMGHLIAEEFKRRGAKVTVLEGPVTHALKTPGIKVIKYAFFEDLQKSLKIECAKKYDVIVHAAAVSDFKPRRVMQSKLASNNTLKLDLVPTPKLINDIKKLAPDSLLVGFKLEPALTRNNMFDLTKKLFIEAQCDLVVANNNTKGYQGYLIDADGNIIFKGDHKKKIAKELTRILH